MPLSQCPSCGESFRGDPPACPECGIELFESDPDEEEDDCPGCRPGGREDEHVSGCEFGPEAYKSHRPGCECWDCKAAREDGEPVDGEGSDLD
jgi:hypothetical protein